VTPTPEDESADNADLDRKLDLLRDLRLRQMWSQALTIALVVASGIGGFITSLSAVDSLALARDRFYAEGRFADVFATVKRAPSALGQTLREIPGVADVQTTTEFVVRIDTEDSTDPIVGQLIGIDRAAPLRMNRVTLRGGRPLDEARAASAATAPSRRSCRTRSPMRTA
jgi:putative ABC transport system permease protein